ncbi:MAG: transporter, family, D-galactonate transporter [Cryptosporangiaceae bacterium]|nr:transporter, family, D-galactonate transporter [Cryptosporangiaceae bacterium]
MGEQLRQRPAAAGLASAFTGRYRTLWMILLLGWVVSYADRTLTGPVIAWMIDNKAGFIGDAANPAALGGLVGSMFFTGYMLTQYPGGRLGDRYGHREMILVSLLWAGVLTIVSGLVAGLIAFVAARVLTGLGEGVFYSNDRTLIINESPVSRRTLGLGVVISGLAIGLTLGIVLTPVFIGWGDAFGLGSGSWRMPFFLFGAFSLLVAALAYGYFRSTTGRPLRLRAPAGRLALFSIPTFLAIVALFLIAEKFRWPEWGTALGAGVLAAGYVTYVVRSVARAGHASTLLSRDVTLLYIGYIAVLYNLWFFSFWSVQIVKEAAHSSLMAAGLTAAFNAGAGIIGFPAGGWIADWMVRNGHGRKPLLLGCSLAYTVLAIAFGFSVAGGRAPSLILLGLLLFSSGLFFNALQPIAQSITGDMVPGEQRGRAFGLLNLISEIGAVASPVVSGILRDKTGTWSAGVFLAAGIMAVAIVLWVFVRERMPALPSAA